MISQAIPQALMSFFTIIVTFISMLVLSPVLTILAVVVIGIMITVTKAIGGNSGKYFILPAKIISRCDRIYRRENEWTESCQSL